jgi:hypothetical protein
MNGRLARRRANKSLDSFRETSHTDLGIAWEGPPLEIIQGVIYLDGLYQTEEILDGTPLAGNCNHCAKPRIGKLDESKLHMVPGYLHKSITDSYNRVIIGYGTSSQREVKTKQWMFSEYAIRQQIVNSGLYTRSQLRKSNIRFTEHELEVSERQFTFVRCRIDCCWHGARFVAESDPVLMNLFSEEGLASLGDLDFPDFATPQEVAKAEEKIFEEEWGGFRSGKPVRLTGVESEFISGKPVRTGFRRRSPEARMRRKLKSRDFSKTVEVTPQPHPDALGTGLFTVNPQKVVLVFKNTECLSTPRKVRRKLWIKRLNVKTIEKLSRRDFVGVSPQSKKESYFLRKNGRYYHSVHSNCGEKSIFKD